ncbi:MAG: serine/threonine-protein kinase [Myxococcota bacterium]
MANFHDTETRPIEHPGEARKPRGASDELGRGELVGRYTVLDRLGEGGMGVVYKAYDPQLDRNVALKLLRRSHRSQDADHRLLREAQTMAKLRHPNVVAVYDAGLTDHGMFIAMELLEGRTLAAWLEDSRRTVREILDVFVAAGRGLSAAHDVGFIHRDFKPANVIVEWDGSVRVLDFGIAHLVDDRAYPTARSATWDEGTGPCPGKEGDRGRRPGCRSDERFQSEPGVVLGTPAFMSPEQLLAQRIDHRSDQFAFAMSLYVALYDRPPAGGHTYEERCEGIDAGPLVTERELEVSASRERVPIRVRRAIVGGLAARPGDRFEDMEPLLDMLEPTRRRWGGIAAAFTLLLGFGVGAATVDDGSVEPCLEPEAALAGVWGPDDRDAVQAAFASHGGVDGGASHRRVDEALGAYARDWVDMYAQSCRATFVEHQQSERLFDQRMRCLVRRRNRLRSAVESLVGAEDEQQLVQRTILAYKLPALEPCADVEQVSAAQPLPDSALARGRVAALRERIDEVDTRYEAGDFALAVGQASAVVDDARGLGYAPVLGEALEALGRSQAAAGSVQQAEQVLREAVVVAHRAGDDRTTAFAWTGLVFVRALFLPHEDISILTLAAQAAVERAGDERIRGWLLNNLGVLHGQRQELPVALEHLRRALSVKKEVHGKGHVDVGISWFNLGMALHEQGAHGQAEPALARARMIFEATVGPSHSMTHLALKGQCRVALAQGDPRTAVDRCTAALQGFDAARPEWVAGVEFTLARAQWVLGRHREARALARRARSGVGEDPEQTGQIARWLQDPGAYERAAREGRAPGSPGRRVAGEP